MGEKLEPIDDRDEATADHPDEIDEEEEFKGLALYNSIDDLDDEAEF